MFTALFPSNSLLLWRGQHRKHIYHTVDRECVGLFTELLPGNALIKSVTVLADLPPLV
jgi:hypothetical protein